jgi:hypothetical protein
MERLDLRLVARTLAPALLVLALAALAGRAGDISFQAMMRDPNAFSGSHALLGAMSNLGVLLWAASASIWLFSARGEIARFATASGALSIYFALDDLFQFHERLALDLLGVRERYAYVLIACTVLAYCFWFRAEFLKREGVLLAAALSLLGGSAVFDTFLAPFLMTLGDWAYFVEDGTKWLGACFWCGFCVARCGRERDARTRPSPA